MTSETDGPTPDESALRSLERTLRRDKLALERINPLERPDHYAQALAHVADLEAERRELRERVRRAQDGATDASESHEDDTSSDDTSD